MTIDSEYAISKIERISFISSISWILYHNRKCCMTYVILVHCEIWIITMEVRYENINMKKLQNIMLKNLVVNKLIDIKYSATTYYVPNSTYVLAVYSAVKINARNMLVGDRTAVYIPTINCE